MDMLWKQAAIERLKLYEPKRLSLKSIPQEIRRLELEMQSIRSATSDGSPSKGGGSGREDMYLSNIVRREELECSLEQARIWVSLYDRVKTGTDAFNAPVYAESPTEVKNVLVCPVSTEDIITDFQLYGRRAEYELCIPKGDTHIWENRTVEFFGKKWRTFGIPLEWMEHRVPLPWNKRVKVERYG